MMKNSLGIWKTSPFTEFDIAWRCVYPFYERGRQRRTMNICAIATALLGRSQAALKTHHRQAPIYRTACGWVSFSMPSTLLFLCLPYFYFWLRCRKMTSVETVLLKLRNFEWWPTRDKAGSLCLSNDISRTMTLLTSVTIGISSGWHICSDIAQTRQEVSLHRSTPCATTALTI